MFTKLDSQSLCIYLELLSMKGIEKSITLQSKGGRRRSRGGRGSRGGRRRTRGGGERARDVWVCSRRKGKQRRSRKKKEIERWGEGKGRLDLL